MRITYQFDDEFNTLLNKFAYNQISVTPKPMWHVSPLLYSRNETESLARRTYKVCENPTSSMDSSVTASLALHFHAHEHKH